MSTPTTEGEGTGSNSSPQPEEPPQEGSLCPVCLQEMVGDLCSNQPQCGHVYHWACVEGKGVLQCPCCQAAPFNPRRLFVELGRSQAAVAAEGAGGAEEKPQLYTVEEKLAATQEKLYLPGYPRGKWTMMRNYRVQFPTGNVFEGKYNGEKVHGPLPDPIKDGTGKMTYSKGGSYDGGWMDGFPHGHGTKVFANGDEYTGNFVKGAPEGDGTLTGHDGSELKGSWVRGAFTKGTWKDRFGTKHTGSFRGLALQGEGMVINVDGSIVEGTYVDGVLSGAFEINIPGCYMATGRAECGKPVGPVNILDHEAGSIVKGTAEGGNLTQVSIEELRSSKHRRLEDRPIALDRLGDLLAALQ
eukprot:GHVU01115403.1.p1 GENE.GHVU01115403.1~~GHVU01115403.1.p1  ORF type:complete len:356 (+),score=64.41 GHVU01115403.1:633-1700(+)